MKMDPYNRTKHLRILATAFTVVCLVLGACTPTSQQDRELKQFSSAFTQANQAASIEPLMALYALKGCDPKTVSLLKAALLYELGLPIKSILFEPLSGAPEESINYVHNDIHYGPTLEPKLRMRVIYDVDDGFTSLFTIGQTRKGKWRIICAKPLPAPSIK